jgi:hypothetical protein
VSGSSSQARAGTGAAAAGDVADRFRERQILALRPGRGEAAAAERFPAVPQDRVNELADGQRLLHAAGRRRPALGSAGPGRRDRASRRGQHRPPSGCFDLVHERMLLLNVTSPHDVVAEMARLADPAAPSCFRNPTARPGPSTRLTPPGTATDEVTDVYPRTGRDFHTGRRAARLLREAGLQDIQARVLARLTAPGEYFHTFLLT